tara:strand:+ start:3941 stop:4633 length:693 start_codon:yes stop_codon:yes gene_type:complete
MKLLFENWRRYLTEAAASPQDLADKNYHIKFNEVGDDYVNWVLMHQDKHGLYEAGSIHIQRTEYGRKQNGPCLDAWMIEAVDAPDGFGPLMYDVAMEWATQNGSGLMPDRYDVSGDAREVWRYYISHRSDVTNSQLDDLKNTLTPEPEDNCAQNSAGVLDWQDSPLSKVYQKSPASTTQELKDMNLWKEETLDERCQKGYKTHEKRKTKKMYGKTYRNCVKAENKNETSI